LTCFLVQYFYIAIARIFRRDAFSSEIPIALTMNEFG